jgi:hypothetical protein
MNGDYVFILEFYNGSGTEYVWAMNKQLIDEFMRQHMINPNAVRTHVILEDKISTIYSEPGIHFDDRNELKVFKMGSNQDHKIHNVVTIKEYIDCIIEDLCDELISNTVFGDAITREEFQIIKEIQDNIEALNYGIITDFCMIEENDDYYSHIDYSGYPSLDKACIYDAMYNASNDDDIQPFTLEAYAHYLSLDIFMSTPEPYGRGDDDE